MRKKESLHEENSSEINTTTTYVHMKQQQNETPA